MGVEFQQISVQILIHQKEVRFYPKHFDQFDDVRVFEVFEEFDFSERETVLLRVERLFELFNGHDLVCLDVAGLEHVAEGPLVDEFDDVVVVFDGAVHCGLLLIEGEDLWMALKERSVGFFCFI